MIDLGIDKPTSATRVIVAMSGGVDSSVTAAMLAEAGYDVVGITLQLYDHGEAVRKAGACCAGQDIRDARRVADRLGIAHYVLDYETRFRDAVIDDFVDSYVAGETPIPCVRCNQTVKFRDLLTTARDLDGDALATGHYVRRALVGGRPALLRAADDSRDQSYFLFATTAGQLEYLRFPLGALAKDETRRLAQRYGLAVADKPDSQDICFVPNGNYAGLIERLRPDAMEPGDIVDRDGNVLGRHDGIARFTVGQRRGLGIGGTDEPMFVVRIDAAKREVVVGPRRALAIEEIDLGEVNWLGDEFLESAPRRVSVKVRSAMDAVPAELFVAGAGARIRFGSPQFGIAPGQACVFYDGDRVLGGGWIRREATALAA